MTINWFPGHMNKARRQLQERARKSDMVLEVVDARLPRSSQNPMLGQWCPSMPTLRVLTKPDLADPAITKRWLTELCGERIRTLELVATEPRSSRRLVKACRDLVPKRGRPGFPVRVMIAGIPNVGKSTLFNLLVGERKAKVRDQPAVTKTEQRIDVPGGLSLIDTPGVLWPKLDDQAGAHRLAASGAIRDTVYDAVSVARFVVEWLQQRYPDALASRYRLPSIEHDVDEILRQIATRRGCLTKGVGPDMGKVSELLLGELRSGKIGRLSFESPEDFAVPGTASDSGTGDPPPPS
jgi:ribosome biogenesis GTPase A